MRRIRKGLPLWVAVLGLASTPYGIAADADADFFQYIADNDQLVSAQSVSVSGGKISAEGEGKNVVLVGDDKPLLSNVYLGDTLLKLEYMVADGTDAGVYLQGRYEIALADKDGDTSLTYQDAGGIQQRWDGSQNKMTGGIAPTSEVDVKPGTWHTLEVRFRAPRYDEASAKSENAFILDAKIDGKVVQKNVLLEGFTADPIQVWETTSGPAMLRVRSGQAAVRSLQVKPADFDKIALPGASGGDTNESELIDFAALGEDTFMSLGCKECHAVAANDPSMKTGPNLYGLFKKTPRDREIVEAAENHRFTVKADFSYLERAVRSPAAELAIHEGGDKAGEAYLPIMPPYMKQTLTDKQLDAIGFYLQTLNNAWEQGPAVKLVESSGPEKYDPLLDDLQFLVDDRVRIQRGPLEGVSARAVHIGQPNAVNYSFDPRILGIAKVWQGGFLDMTGELTNRGGSGLKTGFETREIDLGELGILFAPLNASGELIDFSFKEAVFQDTSAINAGLNSELDQQELIAAQNAQFLGYARPSRSKTAAPHFHYRVGKNSLAVTTDIADNGKVSVTVGGQRGQSQSFKINTQTLSSISVSSGKLQGDVWVLPAGNDEAQLSASIALATSAWKPKASGFNHLRQPLKVVEATADLPAGYSIESYLPPQDNYGRDQLFEALGLALAQDGTVVVATRTAGIWRIKDGEWQLFAEGLFDSLGVQIEDEHGLQIVVGQKAELTRITDTDGDGMGDKFDTLYDQHSYHGNYHTYVHGPARAADGAYHINFNLAHTDEAVYKADGLYMGSQGGYSGWNIRVTPEGEGSLYASGLRSPAGLATGPDGQLWYTENQGEFVGTSKLFTIEEGKFYGHPSGLVDLPGMTPESPEIQWEQVADRREEAVVLFPHNIVANAPGNPIWDTTEGAFGPFAGQMLVGDQTQSNLLRVVTEKVGEHHQGVVIPFMSGLASGVMRGVFMPDGSLLVGQTGRGWQAKGGHVASLQRIRWDGTTVAAAIATVEATSDGFLVRLTQPAATDSLADLVSVRSWTYRDAPDYGSPEMAERDELVAKVTRLDGGKALQVQLADISVPDVHPQQTARVYEVTLGQGVVDSNTPPLKAYYSLYRFAR
ncbi:DUF1080 domain-containing protein [Gilvimarinus sp. SDUM040013]|uniref:Family 16 glycoside hydrolase n=1 Tax=Gilvimarinus gilvus TaxID=3058038 RepID=A0ABU4S2N5_9GAMM|nr:family 16 glycoside hydrolase [Gilvimarinus sp. SDUM040013]MDO3385507.1 DUF1080 domain-containing protein [Gilvimarinus sp. SDUM040013]MDX6851415.1 family 16 glycoside hydrolase [Gilvimarinus sp. SDUM040013]